jgi:hypothetical protein
MLPSTAYKEGIFMINTASFHNANKAGIIREYPHNTCSKSMAKLSDNTLTMTFQLLRQLAEAIELASATEWIFFERYGETPRTIGELEELQNARERLNQSYSRLNTLLLRILEAQPIAANAMLDLWAKAIDNGQANLEAANASIQEIKRGWNLS